MAVKAKHIAYGAGATALAVTIATSFIGGSEGDKLRAYPDVNGVPTICGGVTGKDVHLGQVATQDQCDAMTADRVKQAVKVVDNDVIIPLSPYQRAGVASFVYNVGQGAFEKSTMLKLLNQNKIQQACDRLRLWVYVGGKDCRIKQSNCGGIVTRREMERAYCLNTMGGPNDFIPIK